MINSHQFTVSPRTGLPRSSRFPLGDNSPAIVFVPQSGYSVVGANGFVDGENITITGSGFGVKTHAAPMYLWDSRTGNLSPSPLSRRSFTINQGSPKSIDSTVGLSGRGSMRSDLKPSSGVLVNSGSQIGGFTTDLDGGGMNLMMFDRTLRNWDGKDAYADWLRLASSESEWNIKDYRYWANIQNGSINTNHWVGYGQGNSVNGRMRITYEYTPPKTSELPLLPGMPKNIWKTNYYKYKVSSAPDVSDGFVKVFQNSTYGYYLNTISRTSERPDPQNLIASMQYQYIYTDQDWYDWWDIIYIDDTFHAVMLTDGLWGSNYASYEVAIPISWSDTEIVANLRDGEWGDLYNKYLYVVRADGDPVLIGQFV
jgi:hypothetical protein